MNQATVLGKEAEKYLTRINDVVEKQIKKTKRMVQKLEKLDKELCDIFNEEDKPQKRKVKRATADSPGGSEQAKL